MNKNANKIRRQQRIRRKIRSTSSALRLTVYRSNKHIYAQIIDDAAHRTLLSAFEKEGKGTKTERAKTVGLALAKAASAKKIKAVVFDKGSYAYHGRVKALAEGAREGGLTF
jgi:large subunit ribosomal protein L18